MLHRTIFPVRDLNLKPAFWGLDRDLKEVIDGLESAWNSEGYSHSVQGLEFHETDQAFAVSMDVPGVNKNDINLEIEQDKLTITATRKSLINMDEKKKKISRTLSLPKTVDTEKIEAKVVDGVLYLALPKYEKVQPKKINITENNSKDDWSSILGFKKSE